MVNMDSDPIVPDKPKLEEMILSDVVPASLVDSGASGEDGLTASRQSSRSMVSSPSRWRPTR
eukprot:2032207-Pyramimonas_sp.AAC.1